MNIKKQYIFVALGVGAGMGLIFLSWVLFIGGDAIEAADDPRSDVAVVSVGEAQEVVVEKVEEEIVVSVIFAGDMIFDRYIRQLAISKGYDYMLEDLSVIMGKSDMVMGNLEGPITENDSISLYSKMGVRENYIFTFDPAIVPVLERNNFGLVNIGNNHIGNFGPEGVVATKKFLEDSSVAYIGDTGTVGEKRFHIADMQGVKVGFVNYNEFVNNARENTLADIQAVRNGSDFVVVYTHWGLEYKTIAHETQQDLAYEFIDQGADLIIGSHPHVVQNSEEYKGKKIYYSLGNFIFDQYFSAETKEGLLVRSEFHLPSGEISFEEINVQTDLSGVIKIKEDLLGKLVE